MLNCPACAGPTALGGDCATCKGITTVGKEIYDTFMLEQQRLSLLEDLKNTITDAMLQADSVESLKERLALVI